MMMIYDYFRRHFSEFDNKWHKLGGNFTQAKNKFKTNKSKY